MIIFLYGADSFRLKRKLQEMKNKFVKDVDADGSSLDFINGQSASLKDLEEKINTGSLFARKRLIIIDDIFKNKKTKIWEEIQPLLIKISNDDNIILIFKEDDLEGKNGYLKTEAKKLLSFLKKQKYVQEFKPLSGNSLLIFIKEEAKIFNKTISQAAAHEIIRRSGNDLWLASQTIKKAALGKEGQNIEQEDIERYSVENFNEDIFALTDAIGANNKRLAIKIIEEQYAAGLESEYIIAMLARHFKILLQAYDALKNGLKPETAATELKLHPFVIRKGMAQAKNFKYEQLLNYLNRIIALDFANKTGLSDIKTELSLLVAGE